MQTTKKLQSEVLSRAGMYESIKITEEQAQLLDKDDVRVSVGGVGYYYDKPIEVTEEELKKICMLIQTKSAMKSAWRLGVISTILTIFFVLFLIGLIIVFS